MTALSRLATGLAALLALAAPAIALAANQRAATGSDVTPVGQGPGAELCRAEAAWGDKAARILDSVRTVRCLGWTDTPDVGRVYAVVGGADAAKAIEAAQTARMLCGPSADVVVPGLGPASVHRCRRAGYSAFAFVAVTGGHVYAAEGLARFDKNILAALSAIRRGPALAALPPLGAAAEPAAMAVIEGVVDAEVARAQRSVVIGYNVLGRHGEARQVALRNAVRPAANPADRIDARLEAALTSANLNLRRSADEQFAAAAALLNASPDLSVGDRNRLLEKQGVYLAIAAIDRRQYDRAFEEASSAATGAAVSTAGYTMTGNGLVLDAGIVRQVNAVGGREAAGAAAQLRAQALYVIAVVERIRGHFTQAMTALGNAEAALAAALPGKTGETPNIQWLRSALATEHARVAEAPKNPQRDVEQARAAYLDAVVRLDGTGGSGSVYAETPLLAQRLIDQAAFLVRDGKADQARAPYARAARILGQGGAGYAAGVSGLGGYLRLLAEAGDGAPPEADRDEFFYVAQLFNPLAVSAQIAQLKQVAESGSSEAAVRAKAISDLTRLSDLKRAALSSSTAAGSSAEARLRQDLAADEASIALLRSQQSADRQYQQVSDTPLTRAELQASLLPGEGYYKLVSLPGKSYAMLIERDASTLFSAGSTKTLRDLADTVRKGSAPAGGGLRRFDIVAAEGLYQSLFGPVLPQVARLTTLVTEPAGVMSQLPYAVLVSDPASADRYAQAFLPYSKLPKGTPARVRAAFDYSTVGFLGTRPDIGLSTSVSPRAFLTVRNLASSTGGYIGFGDAVRPAPAVLAELPQRGSFRGQCSATDARRVSLAFDQALRIPPDELTAAKAAIGGDALLVTGKDFTDSDIVSRPLRGYSILHFATHGLVQGRAGCDQPPALLTSVGNDDSEGLLTMDEIAGLTLDANLVVLSACDTAAVNDSEKGVDATGFAATGGANALTGLVRSFLYAGARSVLTTYWEIPETAPDTTASPAATMMSTMFSSGVRDRLSIAKAVSRAQIALHGDPATSHPGFWGAFVLIGDGTKPLIASRPQVAQHSGE